MANRVSTLVAAGAFALGLNASAVVAAAPKARIEVPPVPANLEVPEGHSVFLEGQAVGTQNYICLATTTGESWRFLGPQATLFLTFGGGFQQQITTHFLSANPAENGTPRPTWQHSFDSSQVWGRAAASSQDPNFVAPGAIPWLLVEATGSAAGPTGGGALARTTFIQRLNTSGGVAPATGCSQAADVGVVVLVPYSTEYFFYRQSRSR